MRNILSAAAGGVAVGLIALMTIALTGRTAEPTGFAHLEQMAAAPASSMPVQCAAWEDAIVERVNANAMRVTCVERAGTHSGGMVSLASVRQEPVAQARPAVTERIVYRDPPRVAERTTAKSDRPVSKSVLIIAGASGAGAGAGGLIGGKKGALAGAAIGGGAAAIYEAVKR